MFKIRFKNKKNVVDTIPQNDHSEDPSLDKYIKVILLKESLNEYEDITVLFDFVVSLESYYDILKHLKINVTNEELDWCEERLENLSDEECRKILEFLINVEIHHNRMEAYLSFSLLFSFQKENFFSIPQSTIQKFFVKDFFNNEWYSIEEIIQNGLSKKTHFCLKFLKNNEFQKTENIPYERD